MEMKYDFREITFERTELILEKISNNIVYQSGEYTLVAIGHWHGDINLFKRIMKKYHGETLLYRKTPLPWKYFFLYFVSGDSFCFQILHPVQLHKLYEDMMQFLSISFYFIQKDTIMPNLSEMIANNLRYGNIEPQLDDWLTEHQNSYFIYRIDTDAPTEEGFTEEFCYNENTPKEIGSNIFFKFY